jgi:hypothetical protein
MHALRFDLSIGSNQKFIVDACVELASRPCPAMGCTINKLSSPGEQKRRAKERFKYAA